MTKSGKGGREMSEVSEMTIIVLGVSISIAFLMGIVVGVVALRCFYRARDKELRRALGLGCVW